MSTNGQIKVNFIKKTKNIKSVLVPGFDPIEKTKKEVKIKKPATNDSDEQQSFFSDQPEQLMDYDAFNQKGSGKGKNDTEKLDTEDFKERPLSQDDSTHNTIAQESIRGTLPDKFYNSFVASFADEGKSSRKSDRVSEDVESEEPLESDDEEVREQQKQVAKWYTKAIELAESQEYIQALGYFERVLLFQPANHLVHEYKAQIYLELEMYLEALKAIETSIQCNSSWYISYLTLARCQREVGELALSFESFQKCRDLYLSTKRNQPEATPDPFLKELSSEIKEVEHLLSQLQEKQTFYQKKLEASESDDMKEINSCFYHLSLRARSRCQIEAPTSSENVAKVQHNPL